MNKKMIGGFVFFLFFLIVVLTGSGYTSGEKTEVKASARKTEEKVFSLAVQPTTKPAISVKRYQPLVDYLKEVTKLNIELKVTDNYKDFDDLQKQGKLDFVIQDAFSAYLTAKHVKLAHIANVISPEGKLYDPGYIIVRADSGIRHLADLKGKTLLFGPKANAAKFLAPYILLKEAGIDMDRELTYAFGGLCPDNAMAVFLGDYNASVVCGLYMAQPDKKFNFKTDLRIIARTGNWVPYWVVSSPEQMDQVVLNKVKQALLELDMKNPRTATVFSVCKWKGFSAYSGELNKIDKLVQKHGVPH
ncbi:MAG: phosphate/phosphite/phosphonate ABC transporter substrate-binding protein [Desulfovibrionales bacterium]|nr:phosphate/phosphite/phosphonate ABC transporter substrate-binding protein [Desulfovibrionales bacterium]